VTRRASRLRLLLLPLLLLAPVRAGANFAFPPPPPPEEFGNLLLDRTASAHGVKPVSFSHWLHRLRYTCRVCHFEIQFNFQRGTTEITEEANRAGQYCGTCHDGKELFGHQKPEDCEKCHNGDLRRGVAHVAKLWRLPEAKYGNRVDWDAALETGAIKPLSQLTIPPAADSAFSGTVMLEAVWAMGPDAVFPHGKHTDWLDCNDCHPTIFNIKKKFNEGLEMMNIVDGEFCGVCHRTVAFPLTDCVRCHPKMKSIPSYPLPAPRE
jgi:c(7)-type cytochrome triheme protein